MKAMILAAGRGTRMAPLTDHCPKPLLPLAGKPLIVHHIEKLVAAGITDIVINHAWLGAQIETTLGDGSRYGARLQYSPESQALETGGGILQALPLLGSEPFFLVNGDVWTGWDYQGVSDIQLGDDLGWLWLVQNPDHNPSGDFILQQGRVLNPATVGPELELPRLTFSGLSVLHPQLLAGCEPGAFPLAPLLRRAMDHQRMAGALLEQPWVDVGTPQRLQQLEQYLQHQHKGRV